MLPSVGLFGGEGGDNLNASSDDMIGKDDDPLQDEVIKPRKKLPPLLTNVVDRSPERLHWLGVSYGLTTSLLQFWNRHRFQMCYVRQSCNELTGEHSCIVLREISTSSSVKSQKITTHITPRDGWLESFVSDYRRRLNALMSYSFAKFETVLALTLLDPNKELTSSAASSTSDAMDDENVVIPHINESEKKGLGGPLTAEELVTVHMSYHDLQRLELYERNMVSLGLMLTQLHIDSSILSLVLSVHALFIAWCLL